MASPYSTGSGGPHLEAAVAAYTLVAVLCEDHLRALPGLKATEVRTQRNEFNEPLDDIIISGVGAHGEETKLHLQITNQLSFTEKDAKWRDIIQRAWKTFSLDDFDPVYQSVGVGIGKYNAAADGDYQPVLSWAQESIDGKHFLERVHKKNFSSTAKSAFVKAVRSIIDTYEGRSIEDDEIWRFFKCFVIVHFDFQSGMSSRDKNAAIDRLKKIVPKGEPELAHYIWAHLVAKAGSLIPAGGGASHSTIRENLFRAGLLRSESIEPADGIWNRRNFVQAVANHTKLLPAISLADEALQLADIYIPIHPISDTRSVFPQNSENGREFFEGKFSHDIPKGNHLIEAPAGSGKSTFVRWLTNLAAQKLLGETNAAELTGERLPVLLDAHSMVSAQGTFTEALCAAVNREMALSLVVPLEAEVFSPYAINGHRNWLVAIDGLEELGDRRKISQVWSLLSSVSEQFGEAFQFIVLSRPGTVAETEVGNRFQRWRLPKLQSDQIKKLLSKYLPEAEEERFQKQISLSGLSELLETPLFCSITAMLYRENRSVPSRKTQLIEAFVYQILERPSLRGLKRDSLLQLLRLISDPTVDLSKVGTSFCKELLPEGLPSLEALKALQKIAERTGLVRVQSGQYIFLHDIFRSYFRAQYLAENMEPSAHFLKHIDPYEVGWTTIEFLFEFWQNAGRDVSQSAESLLGFGDEGVISAAEIADAGIDLSDEVVDAICGRIFREMNSSGPSIWHLKALTKLTRRYELVKEELEHNIWAGTSAFGSAVECAKCLLDAGCVDEATEAFKYLMNLRDEYEPDRIDAAKALYELEKSELAVAVLVDMSNNADELLWRLDAAIAILKIRRDSASKERVAALLAAIERASSSIFLGDIEALIAIGELELVLPFLRRIASLPQERQEHDLRSSDRISACLLIGEHFDSNEAAERLKLIAQSSLINHYSRIQALEVLVEIGHSSFARNLLSQLSPEIFDAFDVARHALKLFKKLGLTERATKISKDILMQALDGRRYPIDLRDNIDELRRHIPSNEISKKIKICLRRRHEPIFADCLARLGERNEALSYLRAWVASQTLETRVEAAKLMCSLGEADEGLQVLRHITEDSTVALAERLKAAEAMSEAGFTNPADEAHLFLVADTSLSVAERCKAASYFNEDGVNRPELVWDELEPLLVDNSISVDELCEVAGLLMHFRGDVDSWWPQEILQERLEESDLAPIDAWKIVSTLADGWLDFDDMPFVLDLARNRNIPMKARIETLEQLNRVSDESDKIDALLIEISSEEGASFYEALEALWAVKRLKEKAHGLLLKLAKNRNLPPKWRLAAAVQRPSWSFGQRLPEAIMGLVRDESIATSERISAYKALPKQTATDTKQSLLNEIRHTSNLTCDDHTALAALCIEEKRTDLAAELVELAEGNRPHTIYDLTALTDLREQLGEPKRAEFLLGQLVGIEDLVLEEIEEVSPFIDAARSLARLNRTDDATKLLDRCVKYTSWWDTEDILQAFKDVAGEEVQRARIEVISDQLLKELLNKENRSTYELWYALERFLQNEWLADIRPVEVIANDAERSIYDRARASAILILSSRHADDEYGEVIGRSVLVQLSADEKLPIEDRFALIPHLQAAGMETLISQLIDSLRSASQLTLKQRQEISGVLSKAGHKKIAAELLINSDERGHSSNWMYRQTVLDLYGKEEHQSLLAKQVFGEDENPADHLLDARDLVLEYGDWRALDLILTIAKDANSHVATRLEAISVLDELGFRELPMTLLGQIEDEVEVDDYWLGEAYLRLGNKLKALRFFERSIKTAPKGYRNQIGRSLAELNSSSLIDKLNKTRSDLEDD
ncbi:hypothetical protein [Rhizobium leguminosarum]|uniref:hypothetical protein n=1 Tax=Rhizobium leguminosarum TaxID=384 RepID=UPI003F9D3D78